MKSAAQYLLAILLILLGIALLCHPVHPPETSRGIEAAPSGNAQVRNRPVLEPTMRLA